MTEMMMRSGIIIREPEIEIDEFHEERMRVKMREGEYLQYLNLIEHHFELTERRESKGEAPCLMSYYVTLMISIE